MRSFVDVQFAMAQAQLTGVCPGCGEYGGEHVVGTTMVTVVEEPPRKVYAIVCFRRGPPKPIDVKCAGCRRPRERLLTGRLWCPYCAVSR